MIGLYWIWDWYWGILSMRIIHYLIQYPISKILSHISYSIFNAKLGACNVLLEIRSFLTATHYPYGVGYDKDMG